MSWSDNQSKRGYIIMYCHINQKDPTAAATFACAPHHVLHIPPRTGRCWWIRSNPTHGTYVRCSTYSSSCRVACKKTPRRRRIVTVSPFHLHSFMVCVHVRRGHMFHSGRNVTQQFASSTCTGNIRRLSSPYSACDPHVSPPTNKFNYFSALV